MEACARQRFRRTVLGRVVLRRTLSYAVMLVVLGSKLSVPLTAGAEPTGAASPPTLLPPPSARASDPIAGPAHAPSLVRLPPVDQADATSSDSVTPASFATEADSAVEPASEGSEVTPEFSPGFAGHRASLAQLVEFPSLAEARPLRDSPRILYRPGVPQWDASGRVFLQPEVQLTAGETVIETLPTPAPAWSSPPEPIGEELPAEGPLRLEEGAGQSELVTLADGMWQGDGAQWLGRSWRSCRQRLCNVKPKLYHALGASPSRDQGIGPSRLPYAPFFIERTQPLPNHVSFRFDGGWDLTYPNRSEYFVGKDYDAFIVDYQEFRFGFETGGEKFSVLTELPLRGVDPNNHRGPDGIALGSKSGFSDMAVATRLLVLDGQIWQIAQLFRTTFATGDANDGLGSGHVALEPGVAYRIRLDDATFLYGDLRVNIPVGADPTFAGEVALYGLGLSHVYLDADDVALLTTLEVAARSYLDGKSSSAGGGPPFPPNAAFPGEVDVVDVYPGIRLVFDTGGDIEIWELGLSVGLPITGDRLESSRLRAELRWNF